MAPLSAGMRPRPLLFALLVVVVSIPGLRANAANFIDLCGDADPMGPIVDRAKSQQKELVKLRRRLLLEQKGAGTSTLEAEVAKLRKGYEELAAELQKIKVGGAGTGGHAEGVDWVHRLYARHDRKSQCTATHAEMKQYLNYVPREACPDDWFFVQHLIFKRNCFCLPRRSCFTPHPTNWVEKQIPFPDSLFSQESLDNSNIRWNNMYWPNFEALNARKAGDCLGCWNMTTESWRWRRPYHGTIPMDQVLAMKAKGSLKIGLDAGGGSGSFAAHMAQRGITVVTTAMNTETLPGEKKGLPYMETIAARGLIPLLIPHTVRQPFFDGTLDVIHSASTIKYLSIPDFEALLFEWDRILRPGGIMWFELFYAPVEEMPKYVAVIEFFKYKRLYWNMSPKEDSAEHPGPHVCLSSVLEKPYT